MRVLICGSRDWDNPEPIKKLIDRLPKGTVVIEGEQRGADKMAARLAKEAGFQVDPYPADWTRYHKAAGPIRNKQMLIEGKPDIVYAFYKHKSVSKGTANMVAQARSAEVMVEEYIESL